ncbi:hypothetical protein C0Q70_04915 [Pomacea canaliculata]|uniref:Bacterial surface antigen (D15) domain-containing protein n=1 Tax=Pomacea canaliculata TaxID=400727 RepID=A0A2T7PJT8_POMCA|nr:hypothetical protein C0Q70_04915 [Pomacea canaliculata]
MGTVYAKSPEKQQQVEEDFDFDKIPAKVQRIIVEGLNRTKDDIIIKQVQPILQSSTFQQMVQSSHEVKMRMERLGLFRRVGIFIDTCKDDPACDCYEVTFEVKELRPVSGGINTLIGNNDASLFPTFLGSHSLRWDGIWRDLRALSRTTSFAVREQAGHSLKSSIKHIFVRDMRDDTILPTTGSVLRLIQEYAGLGGNVEFSKQEFELQFNRSLFCNAVLQLSLAGGVMRTLRAKDEIRINDRFFLGGPLTLRGFNLKGVGPHIDGNALGAEAYWLCAAHVYTALPFRPGKGGFGDLFRTHFFVNAGNLGNINFNNLRGSIQEMGVQYRWACGGGIVLRLGRVARMELNYVVPMAVQQGDSVNPGLQFGIGLSFL